MRKPTIAINLTPTDYDALINMANMVYEKMLTNVSFSDPNPELTVIESNINDCVLARARWVGIHDRGSHADLLDLRTKSLTLWQNMIALGKYVASVSQVACGSDYVAMREMMNSSGFPLKNPPTPVGRLEAPQNLRRLIARNLSQNQGKAKWKIPANASSRGAVKGYNIYQGTSTNFSTATFVTSVTKTSYIVSNNSDVMATIYLFIVAIGAAGEGVPTEALKMALLPM